MAEKPHQRKGVKLRSRAGKIANLTIAGARTYPASSRQILSENCHTFPALQPGKICKWGWKWLCDLRSSQGPLAVPYSEERRKTANEAANRNTGNLSKGAR